MRISSRLDLIRPAEPDAAMTQALLLLDQAIAAQKQMLKGYERPSEILAFETVRALDKLFLRDLFPFEEDGESEPEFAPGRATMSWGVNGALRRIIPDVLDGGPFALFRSTRQTQSQADDFILYCGCLAKAERLSGWLREGLVDAEVRRITLPDSPQTEFVILLTTADPSLYTELIGREGLRWSSRFVMAMDRSREEELERRHMEILPDLVRAVDILGDWGITYVSSKEIDLYFVECAIIYLRRMYGQDLLGVGDVIGGRPFAEYLGILTALAARAQKHLCLSAILQRRHPHLQPQNILTTFSPFQNFLVGLTRHLDGDALHVQKLMSHLTLAPDNKRFHLSSGETT